MKKGKRGKKIAIACVLALALGLGAVRAAAEAALQNQTVAASVLALEPQALRSTVTASGVVKSASSTNVYTLVSGCVVQDVHVSVGDAVEAGDILCQLDSSTLEDTLEKQRVSLSVSQNSTARSLSASEKQYQDASANLDAGLNTSVNSARNTTQSALRALEQAQQDYDDARAEIDDGMNSQLVQAEEALEQAVTRLARAEETYSKAKEQAGDRYRELRLAASNAKKEREAAQKLVDRLTEQLTETPDDAELKSQLELAKLELESAQQSFDFAEEDLEYFEADSSVSYGGQTLRAIRESYEDAETARDSASKSLELAQAAVDSQLAAYATALDEAQIAYDNALVNQQAVETSVRQGLEDQRAALEVSRASSDTSVQEMEIESLEEQILDCTVTAPVSGTVTAVNVTVGAAPAGVLFVIEDTSSLEVEVAVKEYDVGAVTEGMQAVVRADALEDETFGGKLTFLAPSASQQAAGTVEYEATVAVEEADTPLRIGMSAKADIIVEEKENVLAVPYEALGVNDEGLDVVYLAEEQEDGSYRVREVPVTLGLEGELSVEAEGEGLEAGCLILSNADDSLVGRSITPDFGGDAQEDASGELMDQMLAGAREGMS